MGQAVYRISAIILVLAAAANAGCANLDYYRQAVAGHVRLLAGSRDIEAVIERGDVSAQVASRLGGIREIKRFAVDALDLPDSRSYRRYVELDREHVVWNVVAAPEFSTGPLEWCFPLVGCLAYRGYFSESAANRFAESLTKAGHDVFVGGVDAYSTLGYLADPVLSSFIDYPEGDIAALLFHELAHQRVYAKNDTAFNESFATAVEQEGVSRWFAARDAPGALAAYLRWQAFRRAVAALMHDYRQRLEALYAGGESPGVMRAHKSALFDSLYREYLEMASRHRVDLAHRSISRRDFNNALVSSYALYHRWVPAFRRILASVGGDLSSFYEVADALAGVTTEARRAILDALMGEEEDP